MNFIDTISKLNKLYEELSDESSLVANLKAIPNITVAKVLRELAKEVISNKGTFDDLTTITDEVFNYAIEKEDSNDFAKKLLPIIREASDSLYSFEYGKSLTSDGKDILKLVDHHEELEDFIPDGLSGVVIKSVEMKGTKIILTHDITAADILDSELDF